MSYTGTIENGVVKLPANVGWANGTQVRIEKIEVPPDRNELTRKLREIAARMEGLPEDWAQEHDHYIHGTPKRAGA
jgi:predicted DNA-binding antitoxin AbrB/MazE fold protein